MTKTFQGNVLIYALAVIGLIAVGGLGGYLLWGNNSKDSENNNNQNPDTETAIPDEVKYTTITGILDFSGLKPTEGDKEIVRIYQKKHFGNEDYADTGIFINLKDNEKWTWDKAIEGESYDIKAILYSEDGKEITESTNLIATAPATEEVLVLNVTWEDLPDETVKEFPVKVSGVIIVNGYIPSGSNVYGLGRRLGSDDPFVKTLTFDAKSQTSWEWDKALNGREYELKAQLVNSSGEIIGESEILEKSAPFSDGNLTVNSTAKAPVQKASLKGKVKINGAIPSGSEVDIHIKKSSDSDYSTVTTVMADNAYVSWEWDDAISGQLYNIRAVLDDPTPTEDAVSNTSTLTAPASEVLLSINSAFKLSQPSTPKLKECFKKDDKWKATIKYTGVEGAKKFWVQAGDEEGSKSMKNEKYDAPPSKDSLEVTYSIDKEKDYYTRYSYNNCEECNNDSSYSSFSSSLKFSCDEEKKY